MANALIWLHLKRQNQWYTRTKIRLPQCRMTNKTTYFCSQNTFWIIQPEKLVATWCAFLLLLHSLRKTSFFYSKRNLLIFFPLVYKSLDIVSLLVRTPLPKCKYFHILFKWIHTKCLCSCCWACVMCFPDRWAIDGLKYDRQYVSSTTW